MESKIALSKKFLNKDDLLICPICKKRLLLENNSLICSCNHCYDLSKKGIVNLVNTPKLNDSKVYTPKLFVSRRKFIANDYYKEIYAIISQTVNSLPNNITILDLGCGEGTHSNKILNNLSVDYRYYGFDYSKNAINMASDYVDDNKFFFVADVNSIPILNNSIDVVIDFLSPYNSNEIRRILKKVELLLKYLQGLITYVNLEIL